MKLIVSEMKRKINRKQKVTNKHAKNDNKTYVVQKSQNAASR